MGLAPYWSSSENPSKTAGSVTLCSCPDAERALSAFDPNAERGPSAAGGRASLAFIEGAIADAKRAGADPRHVDAIVTAPISKTSWDLAGYTRHPGHTELFGERFGAERAGMLFVGPHLRVMLVTIHVALARVPTMLTSERVRDAIVLAHDACRVLGVAEPRLAVCGLNPHAGEGGILGSEDGQVILPAINQAQARGINAQGPFPADTIFSAAARAPFGSGRFDCVVAMYHDQGLIPVKLLDGYRAVNVTVMHTPKGAPECIRTSPAHGTAFDIAGRNIANSASMDAAIDLAIEMIEYRRRRG